MHGGSAQAPPTVGEVDSAVLAGRADELVALAEAADGIAVRRWIVQALERALQRGDPGAFDHALLARAAAVGALVSAGAEVKPPPHSVVAPLAAGALGFARRVHVGFELEAGDAAESFSGDTRRAVRAALDAAARHAPPPHEPARYRLATWLPGALEGVLVDGASLGAATYVSAVALWTERVVIPGTAVSASLEGTTVVSVGGLEAKIAALAVRADVRRLLVANADLARARTLVDALHAPLELVGVVDVETLLAAALEHAPATTTPQEIDYVVQDAHRAFSGGAGLLFNERGLRPARRGRGAHVARSGGFCFRKTGDNQRRRRHGHAFPAEGLQGKWRGIETRSRPATTRSHAVIAMQAEAARARGN